MATNCEFFLCLNHIFNINKESTIYKLIIFDQPEKINTFKTDQFHSDTNSIPFDPVQFRFKTVFINYGQVLQNN